MDNIIQCVCSKSEVSKLLKHWSYNPSVLTKALYWIIILFCHYIMCLLKFRGLKTNSAGSNGNDWTLNCKYQVFLQKHLNYISGLHFVITSCMFKVRRFKTNSLVSIRIIGIITWIQSTLVDIGFILPLYHVCVQTEQCFYK